MLCVDSCEIGIHLCNVVSLVLSLININEKIFSPELMVMRETEYYISPQLSLYAPVEGF